MVPTQRLLIRRRLYADDVSYGNDPETACDINAPLFR